MNQALKYENKETLRKDFHLQVFRKIIFKDKLSSEDRIVFKEWIKQCKPNMNYFEFYRNKNVLFEIVKYLGNNELIFGQQKPKKPIRHLYASKIDYLIYNLFFYKVLENPKTMYCGLTNFLDTRPQSPHNPTKKKEWQENYWTGGEKEYLKFIKSYNWGMDIDGETFQDSYDDAKKVFNLLTKFKIKFSVWCSGKQGWHFIIPYEEWGHSIEPFSINKAVKCAKALMLDFVELLKLKNVDYKIYSATRYLKLCFTLDSRNNRVIYPLNEEEFRDFPKNPEKYMSIKYCLSQKNLGFRGAYPGRKSNPKGFNNMIDYLIKELK